MMPLYYLHIRNGDKLEVDPDGTELPDLEAALTEALKVARELMDEVADLGRNAVIEVADGSGETVLTGRVEDGRGSLSHAATPRFPSPLIEPDVRRYRIRLSDRLHRKAHGEAVRGKRSRASTPRSPWITSKVNGRLPRPCTLCRRARKARTRSVTYWSIPRKAGRHVP